MLVEQKSGKKNQYPVRGLVLNEQLDRRCGHKAMYYSEGDALVAAMLLQVEQEGRPLRAYECPKCHCWHLTGAGIRESTSVDWWRYTNAGRKR